MTKRKILVVDDDEAVLEFLQAKIGSRYDVISTNSPENVLSLARAQHPDVIICDIDMPELDGGDISKALFGDHELRGIPVLFLTALASPNELKGLSGQLGGRPAISKSEPITKLVDRIEALLAK